MSTGRIWGVDIGGTTAVLGHMDGNVFRILEVIPTGPGSAPGEILGRIAGMVSSPGTRPLAVGVGIAGLVDHGMGVLRSSPNLPEWRSCDISGILGGMLGVPVFVDNDCNVFAWGGIARAEIPAEGLSLVITLGTGIGGTIVLDGSIVYGRGHAGEFGHMTVVADGIDCPCGSSGCWERYAAMGALVRYHEEAGGPAGTGPREIASLCSGGDPAAVDAFSRFGRWLGTGMASLASCFDPCGFYLAGGLSCSAAHFFPSLRSEFGRRCGYPLSMKVLESAGEAGARGAALMARSLLD